MGASIMAFDPSTATPVESSPTSGGFDPSTAAPVESTTKAVEGEGGAAFGMYPKAGMTKESASRIGTHIGETAKEALLPTGAGFVGFGTGATIAAPYAAAASTALAATGVGAPFAAPVAGAIMLGGGFGGAMVASGAAKWMQDLMHKTFAPEDYAKRQEERKEFPNATFATELGVGLLGTSPKTTATVAKEGVSKLARLVSTPAGQRAVSGGLQGGIEAGSELATEGTVTPWKVVAATTAGVVMPGFNVAGRIPFKAGEMLGSKISSVLPGGVKTPKITPDPLTTKVDETSTPEELNALLQELETMKGKRDATAPLAETAFRNKETGEIERAGPKHDEQRKLETADTHEQGFVDERGNFLTRQEAAQRGKDIGQLPKDYAPEVPEVGLRSEDLRKAGDERFTLTNNNSIVLKDNSKASIEVVSAPQAFSNLVRMEHGEPISLVAKNAAGEEIGRLTYMPNGGPIDVFVRQSDRRKGVATALYDALEARGGKIPNVNSGVAISEDARFFRTARDQTIVKKPTVRTRESYKTDITRNTDERLNLKQEEVKARLANDNENAQRLKEQIDKLEVEHAQLVKDMPEVQFKNKAAPTHEEWHDHVWGSKTLGEAIDKTLATKGLGGVGQRILAKALRQSDFISSAKLELTSDVLKYTDKSGKEKKALGLYYGGSEHRVQLGKNSSITELLHEAMHAGTQKLLLDKTSPAAIEMHKLFDKYQQDHIIKYEEKLQQFKEDNPNATLDDLNKFREENDPYGFENVDEFVAEAFTDKKFQELLSGLNVRERTGGVISNMWDSFKEVVRLNLGVPETARSAFDDVIEHGSTLIEESKGFKRDVNGNIVISPSRLSKEVHDELEREGIPIAHTSPYKFGMFDWVKHALSGEGAMAFGAGTYGSQKDSTNKYYVEMAKQKALDKYLESPEGKADKAELKAIEFAVFEANEKVGNLNDQLKRIDRDKGLLRDELVDPESGIKDTAKKAIQELEALETQLNNEYELLSKDALIEEVNYEFTRERLAEKVKVPTYHSSIKATSDELLDWDSNQQSELVNNAFKTLGIKPANNIDTATELKINQALKDEWYGNLKKDGRVGVTVLGRDYVVEVAKTKNFPKGTLVVHGTGEIVSSFEQAKKSVLEMIYADQGYTKKTGKQLYSELSKKFEPQDAVTRNLITDREAQQIGNAKASIALAEQGVVGNVHDAQGGTEQTFRNYVVFDDNRITQNFVVLASREKKPTPSSTGEPVETPSTSVKSMLEKDKTAVDRTKTDPREVKDLAEFKEIATDIYEKHGPVEAVKFYEAYKAYEKTKLEPIKTTENFVGTYLHQKVATERIVHNNAADIKEMAGKEVDLEKLTYDIDKGVTLTGKAKEIADKFRSLMDDLGKRALENDVIKGWHENYVARNVVTEGTAPPNAVKELMGELFGYGGKPADPKSVTKYGEQRKLKTREDLVRHLDGINSWLEKNGADYRFKLKSDNLAEIYKDYALAVEKTIENKKLVDNLTHVKNAEGESLIRPITAEQPLPYGWKVMDNGELSGYAVHQDLVPYLKFVFDAGPGKLMQALGAISQFVKRFNVIGSFFHAKSLMEAQSSAQIPIWSPLKEGIVLPIAEKIIKGATGKELQLSAISKAVEQFRRGGAGDNVDTWIKTGLGFELPEDVSRNILATVGKFTDSMISKYGPKTRALESSMTTVEKYTLQQFDKYTWDYLHTGLKLVVADAYLDRARMDAAKAGRPFDEMTSRREIAKFVNNSFGGLNWYQVAVQTQNEFAKRMALAAYSPAGRRALQVLLFAPDWTLSTIRAFTAALPKGLNPTKWSPIEGVKGMMSPATEADYARLYQFKTALTVLTLINGINLITAGRPIWENKDPTRIEYPDGTSMQAMKHAMEPYHWIADPTKTLSNKLGFVPKATVIALAGTEYASPNAPKLIDRSAYGRGKAIVKGMAPFQVSAAIEAPEGEGAKRALLGTIGLPLYGATAEQNKLRRAEKEVATKEQAWEYRDKEIKAGRMPWTSKHDKEKKSLDKQRKELDKKAGKE